MQALSLYLLYDSHEKKSEKLMSYLYFELQTDGQADKQTDGQTQPNSWGNSINVSIQ